MHLGNNDGSSARVSATYVEDLEGVPGTWLQSGPTPAIEPFEEGISRICILGPKVISKK